ncbi:hypothetical protein HanRHA438_Chr11g0488081 [Helianthus annuus]|nr:hypothetical protein HanXRQr2_Chr11g0474671 [Helianthus annuus]KAJ0500432.1 hypothetical protein HanHA300_Chr11g0389441 [Helianthus annuus]KAJ0507917.1 hypothetical protein HanIR_Chr11g0511491 [Helianthus annuus]KAJ0516288.1 hypothetical protein HanHA89_Chr11g0412211 [Helianthus annuus]KAJ0684307.1 hypothetical protein HanLR1_Chr11g0389751 [Helianthus annuus]
MAIVFVVHKHVKLQTSRCGQVGEDKQARTQASKKSFKCPFSWILILHNFTRGGTRNSPWNNQVVLFYYKT